MTATSGELGTLTVTGSITGGSSGENGQSWTISSDGTAIFDYITANGGLIGGCTIDGSKGLGASFGDNNWSILSNGTASFNNITASGGYIGGLKIGKDSISCDAWTLSGTGLAFKNATLKNNGSYLECTGGLNCTGGLYISGNVIKLATALTGADNGTFYALRGDAINSIGNIKAEAEAAAKAAANTVVADFENVPSDI